MSQAPLRVQGRLIFILMLINHLHQKEQLYTCSNAYYHGEACVAEWLSPRTLTRTTDLEVYTRNFTPFCLSSHRCIKLI